MSSLQTARAAYLDAVEAQKRAGHSAWVRRRQLWAARVKFLLHRTSKNRAAYQSAKKTYAQRVRTFRRRREEAKNLKADYLREKKRANNPRLVAIEWAKKQVGTTEATGHNDGPKIHAWQRHTARGASYLDGAPYCGIGCENACSHAGVDTTSAWASVASIEDLAIKGRGGFKDWTTNPSRVRQGDLVVLFGRGVHVELVTNKPRMGVVRTIGFNTSPGTSGSQSNGGGVYRRTRLLTSVHGFALVDYQ